MTDWAVQERRRPPSLGELVRVWIRKNHYVSSGGFLEQEQLQKRFSCTQLAEAMCLIVKIEIEWKRKDLKNMS